MSRQPCPIGSRSVREVPRRVIRIRRTHRAQRRPQPVPAARTLGHREAQNRRGQFRLPRQGRDTVRRRGDSEP